MSSEALAALSEANRNCRKDLGEIDEVSTLGVVPRRVTRIPV